MIIKKKKSREYNNHTWVRGSEKMDEKLHLKYFLMRASEPEEVFSHDHVPCLQHLTSHRCNGSVRGACVLCVDCRQQLPWGPLHYANVFNSFHLAVLWSTVVHEMIRSVRVGGTDWSELYCMILRPRLEYKYKIRLNRVFYSCSPRLGCVYTRSVTMVLRAESMRPSWTIL